MLAVLAPDKLANPMLFHKLVCFFFSQLNDILFFHSTSPPVLLINQQSFFTNVRLNFTAFHTIQFTIAVCMVHSNRVIIL